MTTVQKVNYCWLTMPFKSALGCHPNQLAWQHMNLGLLTFPDLAPPPFEQAHACGCRTSQVFVKLVFQLAFLFFLSLWFRSLVQPIPPFGRAFRTKHMSVRLEVQLARLARPTTPLKTNVVLHQQTYRNYERYVLRNEKLNTRRILSTTPP